MVLSQEVEDVCQRLRRRQLEGALPCAKATAELLRTLVTSRRHPDASALLDDVKSTGIKVQDAKPLGSSPSPLPPSSFHLSLPSVSLSVFLILLLLLRYPLSHRLVLIAGKPVMCMAGFHGSPRLRLVLSHLVVTWGMCY